MILEPDGNSGEFIEILDDGLEYLGPSDLTQYFIRTTGMSKTELGSIMVVVVLGRRLLGKYKCVSWKFGVYLFQEQY